MKTNTKRQAPLPFPAWMEKHYPQKTAKRSILKMIGVLDAAYLIYRLQNNGKSEKISDKKVPAITEKPIDVPAKEVVKKEQTPRMKTVKSPVKKVPKPRTKKVAEPVAEPELLAGRSSAEQNEDWTIEFEHTPEPVVERMREPAPALPIEPEPLVLDEEPIVEKPAKTSHAKLVWLDDERLEEVDLRKTDLKLGTAEITVAFETAYDGDDEETLMVVNGVSWRAMLTSPALNLSKMLQILRVSYGELYILGRMALGAMSGDGYITATDAADIVALLAKAEGKTIETDVRYYDKDSTSKKRVAATIHIRFERA